MGKDPTADTLPTPSELDSLGEAAVIEDEFSFSFSSDHKVEPLPEAAREIVDVALVDLDKLEPSD